MKLILAIRVSLQGKAILIFSLNNSNVNSFLAQKYE